MISVIIPTYRRFKMLNAAISSVLAQTYKDIEIIVIDDCSNDGTEQITNTFPNIKYLCNDRNRGPGYSRQRGLLECSGEYVIFLDDDDYYTDTSFYEKAVNILDNTQNCIFVAANALVSHEYDGTLNEDRLNIIGSISSNEYLQGFPFKYKKPHSTFTSVFRKSTLLKVGIATMTMLNDMPLYMRSLTAKGTIYFLEDTIGVYRIHHNNISTAMTWSFIKANLEEKYKVKQYIIENKIFVNIESWWLKQVEITISYFIYGSHPSFYEWHKAKRWCLTHSDNSGEVKQLFKKYKAYLTDYRICKFKSKIKKILGMK